LTPLARARLCVLGAALLWSTAGTAIKNAPIRLEDGGAFAIAAGRALFAAVALAALVPDARRGFSARTWLVAVAYAATTVLFVIANTLTTAANAIFLQDVAPVWVLLLSPLLLGERPTRSELLSAPVYILGTGLFFLDELAPGGALGNGVAIASGVAFALLIVGLRSLRAGGAEAAVLLGNVIAVVVAAPFALRAGAPTAQDVGIFAFLGVFQLGLAYVLFARGVRTLSAVEGSLLNLIEPVASALLALLIVKEVPGPFAVLGAAVILAATIQRAFAQPATSEEVADTSPVTPALKPEA